MGIRTIIFRGKTTSKEPPIREFDNIWVEGDLIKNGLSNKYYIHPHGNGFRTEHELAKLMACHEVQPKTVGQFTGLTDKNGKKIFEGDIVKWDEKEWGRPYNELVEFDYKLLGMREHDYKQWCEVIGNIHDNPEILGE